uniref:Thymus, brain and testes associated n=1 Tax=Gouania willdenowi TaxID=441366 RepID=A0A8C5HWX0_GOUWI
MSSCHFEAATANSPSVRGTTGAERSLCGTSPVPLTADFTTMMSKSCPRFGSLSHHSFFSRHNPHPNRVRHIQGLESLMVPIFGFQEPLQAPWVRSKTQSSPGTGRIIPPHTKSSWRRSNQQRKHPLLFQDQELMVFELLCQILQTDSLSSVQQWLLLAGVSKQIFTKGTTLASDVFFLHIPCLCGRSLLLFHLTSFGVRYWKGYPHSSFLTHVTLCSYKFDA